MKVMIMAMKVSLFNFWKVDLPFMLFIKKYIKIMITDSANNIDIILYKVGISYSPIKLI